MKKSQRVLDPREDSRTKSIHKLNSLWLFVGLILIISTVNLSSRILHHISDLKDSDIPFVGVEAWNHLKVLNSFGPKVSGTKANEVDAAEFIIKQIQLIQSKADKNQNVTLDHQIVSGSYFLGFKPYGMTALYRNVQNIVVRLEGETSNVLMLNCHFDSVPGSPGTADDAANCAIMLELLSILSKKESKNRHSILFLFNGAEEVSLRASHGFITKHKWAKDIRLFINLEAAGSGGKETLFQTGPGHGSWLLNHYKVVSRPFAQAVGEEIFQSGVIPSDTDFRIFRDFGKIPGLDFAHASKGYRYHTKFDSIDFLSIGVLQRTGENILGLVNSIVNSHELDDITKYENDSSAVYFDVLGFFFIYYPDYIGVIINFAVVIFAITLPFLTLTSVKSHTKNIMSETILGFFSILFGTGMSGLVCYLAAFFIDKADYSMSWYRSTYLAPGIYSTLAILCHILVQDILEFTFANKDSPLSLGLRVQAKLNGVNIFWGVLTLTVTISGYRLGYLMMIILLINFITNLLIFLVNLPNSVNKWLAIFIVGQFLTILWTSYFFNMILEIFIPITGRSGATKNPDLFIAIICCAMAIFISSYMIPLVQLLKSRVVVYLTFVGICSICIAIATSTNWGFPYQNESTGNPAVQRHYVAHTVRHFYNEKGEERLSDSGFYFMQWDRHAMKTIHSVAMPETPLHFTEMCNDELFCGLPLISSRSLLLGGQWLPGPTPKISNVATLDSYEKSVLNENQVKISISVNASSLSAMFIRPRGDYEMTSWTFTDKIPEAFNKTYFVSIANGINPEPLKFDLIFNAKNTQNPIVDVTLVSMIFDDQKSYTKEFKNILNRFPDWSYAVDCVSAVTSYVL